MSGPAISGERARLMTRLLACCVLGSFFGTWTDIARADTTLSADIRPQSVADALAEFAHQTGLQLVYVSKIAKARASKGARAGLTPAEALPLLLDGTGLSFEFLNERTVRIFESATAAPATQSNASDGTPRRDTRRAAPWFGRPSDVVVTGARSAEDLRNAAEVQNTAASVSIVSGDRLEAQDLEQLTDYAAYIPGFNLLSGGNIGAAGANLRGIFPITGASAVTFYIDDIPMGPSGIYALANISSLELLPYDLERLEVRRGPQGTLSGASSFGGLIRYVLKPPNANHFESQVGADVSTIYAASSPGASLRAMVNAPIAEDRLALRINAYYDYTPGYVDNVTTGVEDVNAVRQYGGHIATLWRPAESLAIDVSAFWHRSDSDSQFNTLAEGAESVPDSGDAFILRAVGAYGDLKDVNAFQQPYKKSIDLYSASVHWNPGPIELVAITGWSHTQTHVENDLTEIFGANYPLWSNGTVPAGLARNDTDTGLDKFSQELRVAAPRGKRLDWMLGAFYTHESATYLQALYAFDNAYQPIAFFAPALSFAIGPSSFTERALFGDLTWRITDQFDLAGGVRYSHDDQEFIYISGGTIGEVNNVPGRSSEAITTWMTTATYRVTGETMFYGRVARGSQPGAPNGFLPGIPPAVKADTLTNYEVGMKSGFLDHKGLIDLAVFSMDWNDIQINIPNGGVNYFANAGRAKSQGFELTSSYSLIEGLLLGFNAAYTRAEFTRVGPDAQEILTGYQLPNVPRWDLSLTTDYDWTLADLWHAHVGGGFRWVGMQWSGVVQSRSLGGEDVYEMPAYSVIDLNAGVAKGRLAFRAYVRNLTDTRASLQTVAFSYPSDTPLRPAHHVLQPRSFGIGIDIAF